VIQKGRYDSEGGPWPTFRVVAGEGGTRSSPIGRRTQPAVCSCLQFPHRRGAGDARRRARSRRRFRYDV